MSDSTKVLRGEGSQERGETEAVGAQTAAQLSRAAEAPENRCCVLKALPAGQKLLAKPLPCCPFLTLLLPEPSRT